ncbi:MAG TPA: GAF domain-containing protein, partial [Candidatus Wallbacteria bacterium]|nr:GAF domain-containing protein [Candidatus Wallbacteria bacterium]
ITDISKDPDFSKYSKTGADYKTKSVLSVPLIIKDKVIGVINVNNKKNSEVFNDSDLQLLETLATQIATAIENARLYTQKEQRLVEITMLHNLGLALNSSLDLKNIIARIIESMKSIFDADMASIMLWDERRERLRIISHIGLPEQYVNELTFAPGEGVAGAVAKKGKPRLIANTFLEPSYKKHNVLHDELPKSLICSPIMVKNRVEGVICCERLLDKGGSFSEDNLNLLTTISCHAAVAIENSNLYNDLLRVYLETVQSLAAALDAKDSYTHGHSRRVTGLALALAREIGMSENEINTLKHAALLHDIGKIGIAESILQKPSSLTNDEFNCIKNHPITGARILESVEFLKSVCLQ